MILNKRKTFGSRAAAFLLIILLGLGVTPSFAGGLRKLNSEILDSAPKVGMDIAGRTKEVTQFLSSYETRELNVPKFSFLLRLTRAAELAGLYVKDPEAKVFQDASAAHTVAAAIAILGLDRSLVSPKALQVATQAFLRTGESVTRILNRLSNENLVDEVLTDFELSEAEELAVIEAAAQSVVLFEGMTFLSEGQWTFQSDAGGGLLEIEKRARAILLTFQHDILFQIFTSIRLVGMNAAYQFNERIK